MYYVFNFFVVVKLVFFFKDGIVSVICLGFNSFLVVSLLFIIIILLGWRYFKLLYFLKICILLILFLNKFEIKYVLLFGVIVIRYFKIL